MNHNTAASEALVQAWLALSSTVWNRRLVSGMRFNEAYICGLLSHQPASANCTAAQLCRITGLLRSQMNQLLGGMEHSGYILRERSQTDRRKFFIRLTEKGRTAYAREHEGILSMVNLLTERIGTRETEALAAQISAVSGVLRDILQAQPSKSEPSGEPAQ